MRYAPMRDQSMVATSATSLEILSDPLPMGFDSSFLVTATLHGWVGAAGSLNITVEASNDRVYWSPVSGASISFAETDPAGRAKATDLTEIGTAFIRVRAALGNSGGAGEPNSVSFDVSVETSGSSCACASGAGCQSCAKDRSRHSSLQGADS